MRLVTAAAVAAALGIGLLVLQRWVAETRTAAMILVAAWFAVVAIAILVTLRRDLRGAALATLGAIAVATGAIGYWTGFRDRTVDEQVVVATRSADAAERAAALAPVQTAAPTPTPAPRAAERPKQKATATPEPVVAAAKPKATATPEPTPSATPEPTPEPTPTPDAWPVRLLGGPISGADGHAAGGTATVIQASDGKRVLTLTDFDADPGPQVEVYLTTSTDDIDDRVELGGLKGNVGNQEYRIPAGADLNRYDTLVLWCIPFTTRIATAGLK